MPPPAFFHKLSRRSLLLAALAAAPAGWALPARTLQFPRDFGSHPDLQTEWWYITGHAKTAAGREFGFQVTFFRSRIDAAQGLRSAFAARHLVFAHAAVTDLEGRVLLHDQRIARVGFGVASASETDTDVRLRDWSLVRRDDGSYSARIPAGEFSLELRFTPTQPVLLQGKAGLSRKGPDEAQASYYYSEPQLRTQGRLALKGQAFDVGGTAWLDHEWSEALMHPEAVGWDWIGMNLDDGSALTAFACGAATAVRCGPADRFACAMARCAFSTMTRCASTARIRGPARARRPSTRPDGACRRRRAASRCARCSTTRSSTAATPPAGCTGKA